MILYSTLFVILINILIAPINAQENNGQCPCLPKKICPRAFSNEDADLKAFGSLGECENPNYVRCCGASVSKEVSDSSENDVTEMPLDDVTLNDESHGRKYVRPKLQVTSFAKNNPGFFGVKQTTEGQTTSTESIVEKKNTQEKETKNDTSEETDSQSVLKPNLPTDGPPIATVSVSTTETESQSARKKFVRKKYKKIDFHNGTVLKIPIGRGIEVTPPTKTSKGPKISPHNPEDRTLSTPIIVSTNPTPTRVTPRLLIKRPTRLPIVTVPSVESDEIETTKFVPTSSRPPTISSDSISDPTKYRKFQKRLKAIREKKINVDDSPSTTPVPVLDEELPSEVEVESDPTTNDIQGPDSPITFISVLRNETTLDTKSTANQLDETVTPKFTPRSRGRGPIRSRTEESSITGETNIVPPGRRRLLKPISRTGINRRNQRPEAVVDINETEDKETVIVEAKEERIPPTAILKRRRPTQPISLRNRENEDQKNISEPVADINETIEKNPVIVEAKEKRIPPTAILKRRRPIQTTLLRNKEDEEQKNSPEPVVEINETTEKEPEIVISKEERIPPRTILSRRRPTQPVSLRNKEKEDQEIVRRPIGRPRLVDSVSFDRQRIPSRSSTGRRVPISSSTEPSTTSSSTSSTTIELETTSMEALDHEITMEGTTMKSVDDDDYDESLNETNDQDLPIAITTYRPSTTKQTTTQKVTTKQTSTIGRRRPQYDVPSSSLRTPTKIIGRGGRPTVSTKKPITTTSQASITTEESLSDSNESDDNSIEDVTTTSTTTSKPSTTLSTQEKSTTVVQSLRRRPTLETMLNELNQKIQHDHKSYIENTYSRLNTRRPSSVTTGARFVTRPTVASSSRVTPSPRFEEVVKKNQVFKYEYIIGDEDDDTYDEYGINLFPSRAGLPRVTGYNIQDPIPESNVVGNDITNYKKSDDQNNFIDDGNSSASRFRLSSNSRAFTTSPPSITSFATSTTSARPISRYTDVTKILTTSARQGRPLTTRQWEYTYQEVPTAYSTRAPLRRGENRGRGNIRFDTNELVWNNRVWYSQGGEIDFSQH